MGEEEETQVVDAKGQPHTVIKQVPVEHEEVTADNVVSVFERAMWNELYTIEDIWRRFHYWVHNVDWEKVDDALNKKNVYAVATYSGNEMKDIKSLTLCDEK